MVGKKEGKFLTFYLDDRDTIRYDLSTGEQIGVKGKPVKSVCQERMLQPKIRILTKNQAKIQADERRDSDQCVIV